MLTRVSMRGVRWSAPRCGSWVTACVSQTRLVKLACHHSDMSCNPLFFRIQEEKYQHIGGRDGGSRSRWQ